MVAASATLLSTTVLIGKIVLRMGVGPTVLGGYRAAVATVCLFFFLAVRAPSLIRVERKGIPSLALLGLLLALNSSLYFHALQRTPGAVAVVLLYTFPGIVTLLERVIDGKRVGKAKAIALVLTLCGCLLLTEAYRTSIFLLNLTGILAGIGAAIAVAWHTFLGKRLTRQYDTQTMNLYTFFFGGILLLLLSAFQGNGVPRFDLSGWLMILYMAVGPMILGYGLFVGALRFLEASKVGIIGMLEPVLASIWAWVFLAEGMNASQILGATVVMLGVGTLRLFPETAGDAKNGLKNLELPHSQD